MLQVSNPNLHPKPQPSTLTLNPKPKPLDLRDVLQVIGLQRVDLGGERALAVNSMLGHGDGVVEPMRDDAFIGFEKQPFIMQAFYGLIYPKSSHGQGPGGCWSEGSDIPAISCPNEQAPAYFANGTGGAHPVTSKGVVFACCRGAGEA